MATKATVCLNNEATIESTQTVQTSAEHFLALFFAIYRNRSSKYRILLRKIPGPWIHSLMRIALGAKFGHAPPKQLLKTLLTF